MAGFQPSIPLGLTGNIEPTIIHEPGGPVTAPSDIIKLGTNFQVSVKWEIFGTAVALMAGTFNVKVCFEGFGAATEKSYDVNGIAVVPVSGHMYHVHVPVPGADLVEGAYKMIALVTYTNAAGNPGPVAGFSDDILVQVAPLT